MILVRYVFVYSTLLACSLLLLLFYILGAARFVTDFEENTCDMTYMFEYPQYVRISLDNDIEEKYPRYGLYAYGEGFVTEKLRRMHFTGIPVLFIPGNAGCHKQVRSLASVSLRKSLKDRTPFHFDYFTVSLGTDYSGLYGGVLMEETIYVSHCIQRILSLYKSNVDSIVLIGHSMGGIIAKGSLLFTPAINASVASIIIGLATPFKPQLVLDRTFANYYYNLEQEMKKINEAGTVAISIGGGPRDILVPAAQIIDPTADINVLSTSIPDVWKSTDHLSILWCKQLVFSIVRLLFDSVDTTQKPPQISSDRDHKLQAMSYHLLHRASGKRLYRYKEKVDFETEGEWLENVRRQFVWDSKQDVTKKSSTVYLMIRLSSQLDYLYIETINLETKNWLFICAASTIQGQSRVCEWGWNLTNRTSMAADSQHRLRKTVDLNLQELKYPGMTHIIVRIPNSDLENHVLIRVESYSYGSRVLSTKSRISFLPNLFDISKSDIFKFDSGTVRHYIRLSNTQNVVTIELKDTTCAEDKQTATAVVDLVEPWNPGATQVQFFTQIDNGPKTLRIQTKSNDTGMSPVLKISLDPMCSYTFSIRSGGVINQISCIVRDRWPILYTTVISLLLLIISVRIDHEQEKVLTVVVTLALSLIFGITFEICVSIGILCVFTIGTCFSVIFLGSVAHGVAVRFLARAIAFSMTWSDWLLGGLNQVPLVTTVLILSLIPATCGALAMMISVFLFFLKLTRMYEDYLEELLLASLKHFKFVGRLWRRRNNNEEQEEESENTRQKIIDNLILFMLWCFVSISAVPSVLVWAKNFSYNRRLLTEDLVLLGSWIPLVICGNMNLIRISPKHGGYRSQILISIIRCTGWILLSTAASHNSSFYQWCVPPVIAAIVSLISINAIVPD